MNIPCTRCFKLWPLEHVFDLTRSGFKRKRCLIHRCPACPQGRPKFGYPEQIKSNNIRALESMFGEDPRAFAEALLKHGLIK